MEPFQLRSEAVVPYFFLDSWEREFPHLIAGMSIRDGESIKDPDRTNYALHVGSRPERIIQNRRRLAEELGVSFASWTCGEQVHGVNIREVTSMSRGKGSESAQSAFSETDGLLTQERDVLLTSFYADCVPLLFYSADIEMIGVAHAGWRGTVGEISPRMIREFVKRGAEKKEIRIAIGPSIGSCCYEVDEHVVHSLKHVLPDPFKVVLDSPKNNKWQVDLKEANKRLLLKEGLKEGQILVTGWCTGCHPDLFHSHRRDCGKTGRMVAFIGMGKG
ncbi:peptidoglycan editing factor PgeF [Melghirimyces algeriensis]|uniref:Purine nucleoside phosphorylase n=1 Tax=Melghirimyces algeriensis TaxID=910412 RepID=A0A521BLY0_9BACL|nr:peptidoglycan editing factor PgeF [Melghirimyces algeriensis]SMO47791.1 conserved hypothetical protein [Melghirimyces algeriensis]